MEAYDDEVERALDHHRLADLTCFIAGLRSSRSIIINTDADTDADTDDPLR
jgi:hypothetical protein